MGEIGSIPPCVVGITATSVDDDEADEAFDENLSWSVADVVADGGVDDVIAAAATVGIANNSLCKGGSFSASIGYRPLARSKHDKCCRAIAFRACSSINSWSIER